MYEPTEVRLILNAIKVLMSEGHNIYVDNDFPGGAFIDGDFTFYYELISMAREINPFLEYITNEPEEV